MEGPDAPVYVGTYAAFFTATMKVVESGEQILKLITDLRKVTLAFRLPPWIPLSGPGVITGVEISEEYAEGWNIAGASGDAPEFEMGSQAILAYPRARVDRYPSPLP